MIFNNQNRCCHAEPIRFAQGKLREASLCPSPERCFPSFLRASAPALILRCTQDDKTLPILVVKNHYRPTEEIWKQTCHYGFTWFGMGKLPLTEVTCLLPMKG